MMSSILPLLSCVATLSYCVDFYEAFRRLGVTGKFKCGVFFSCED